MNQEDIWCAIDPAKWQSTPCMTSRLAAEEDVKCGRAVFFLKSHAGFGCKPYEMLLPHLALWSETGKVGSIPGVIVQAEHADGKVLVGFRPLAGGNALGTLEEFKLVEDITELAHAES